MINHDFVKWINKETKNVHIICKKNSRLLHPNHVSTSYKVIVKEIYLEKVGMKGTKFYFGWFKMAVTVYIQ